MLYSIIFLLSIRLKFQLESSIINRVWCNPITQFNHQIRVNESKHSGVYKVSINPLTPKIKIKTNIPYLVNRLILSISSWPIYRFLIKASKNIWFFFFFSFLNLYFYRNYESDGNQPKWPKSISNICLSYSRASKTNTEK